MTTRPGEVYLIDLGLAAKSRLMLVVSRHDPEAPRALAVCAPITSSSRGTKYEVAIGKPKFLRENSYVNVQGLQAIQHHELHRRLGTLPDEMLQRVRRALDWLLEIPQH